VVPPIRLLAKGTMPTMSRGGPCWCRIVWRLSRPIIHLLASFELVRLSDAPPRRGASAKMAP
jgi:hypothetical protein